MSLAPRTLGRVTLAAVLVTVVAGSAVLVAWLLTGIGMRSTVPIWSSMKPNTALGLVLAGTALWLLETGAQSRWRRWAARGAAVITGLFGALTVGEYLSGLDLGIDRVLLPQDQDSSDLYPGRMGLNTALTFILLAAALFWIEAEAPRRYLSDAAALLAMVIAFAGFIGYLHGLTQGSRVSAPAIEMTLLTVVLCLIVSTGVLAARDGGWAVRLIVERSPGSLVVRRLLPLVIVIPLAVAWLRLTAERSGLITTELGVAMLVFTSIILLGGAVLWSGLTLERADRQRYAVETQLRESEERFRQLAENIREAFFVVDPLRQRTIYVSPTWAEIWGRPVREAYEPPMSWLEAVHPEDHARLIAAQQELARGEPNIDTFRVIRPDGSARWVRARAFPVRNDAGQVYRYVGVAEDITELKLTEQHLLHAQKMEAVGRLAGGVAHDFNNLLTVIMSYSQFVLDDLAPDDPRRADLEEVAKGVHIAIGLTRQLLAFSRQQVLEPTVLDLNSLVADTGNLLRRLIGEDVELVTLPGDHLGAIRADAGQIEQVLMNLAGNARDAMPAGGRLTIETRNVELDATDPDERRVAPGSYVMLAVRDTGGGMSADVRAHIFEPFFTTKLPGQGTGLGLATVYGIVKQSGGFISCSSDVGRGTTFTIYFPRVADAPLQPEAPAADTVLRGDETILVTEDAASVRDVAYRALTRYGYRVLLAADGRAALELAQSHGGAIHLLLTDVIMPDMSGRQLAERLREQRPGVKVLFVSGYSDDAITRHGVLQPGLNYLQKPFAPVALARKVRDVLDG